MNESLRNPSADRSWVLILDRIVATLLALCPVLQHYKAPVFNAALMVMVLIVPYLLCRMFMKRRQIRLAQLKPVLVLTVYMIYRVLDHGTSVTELGQSCVLIVFFAAAALDCIDIKWMCRTAVVVACVAAAVLLTQYVSFYLFGRHLQMVPVKLLLPSADQWVLGAQTGLASIDGEFRDDGFYRPSAFFLEPSHVYIYSFPLLMLTLLGKKQDIIQKLTAVLLSLGLVLCTSSMGIAAVCAAWGLFIILYDERTKTFTIKNLTRRRTKIILACAFAAFVAAVIAVPQIQRMVVRIFYNEPGKSTAIGGRINSALRGMGDMTTRQWILGVKDTTHGIKYNMPGSIAAIYRHGIIGMILSLEFYTKSIWKLKLPFWPIALVIFVTSFFSAHTHSTVGMMYYVLILMLGYHTERRETGILSALRKRES